MTNFSNNWHPAWYGVLEYLAKKTVTELTEFRPGGCGVDVEELINEGWLYGARYRPPEQYGLRYCLTNIRRNMRKYALKHLNKAKKYNCTVASFDAMDRDSVDDMSMRGVLL